MNQILITGRLTLRELTIEDTAFIIELLNSPGWLQFIGDRNVRTTGEATNFLLNGPIKSYRDNGFGLSLVAMKADNTPIGLCGLLKRATLQLPDIGFALLPGFDGKGYAYEIASALLTHAKANWNAAQVCAIVMPSNQPSIKLIEKLGLKQSGTYLTDDKKELLLFTADSLSG